MGIRPPRRTPKTRGAARASVQAARGARPRHSASAIPPQIAHVDAANAAPTNVPTCSRVVAGPSVSPPTYPWNTLRIHHRSSSPATVSAIIPITAASAHGPAGRGDAELAAPRVRAIATANATTPTNAASSGRTLVATVAAAIAARSSAGALARSISPNVTSAWPETNANANIAATNAAAAGNHSRSSRPGVARTAHSTAHAPITSATTPPEPNPIAGGYPGSPRPADRTTETPRRSTEGPMADPLVVDERITIPADDLDVTFARAGGPGGQHVNTTDTRVRLRFALDRCAELTDEVKGRLRDRNRSWLTESGDLVLTCDASRSRLTNLEEARERLAEAIRAALIRPKPRRPTRPTRSSQHKRLEGKKGRKQVKASRGRVRDE